MEIRLYKSDTTNDKKYYFVGKNLESYSDYCTENEAQDKIAFLESLGLIVNFH